MKASEDPGLLARILSEGADKLCDEESKAVVKVTSEKHAKALAATALSKKKASKLKASKLKAFKACASIVPAGPIAPLAEVELNALSFNRKTAGKLAIIEAMMRGYRSFKDLYQVEDADGNVACKGKKFVNAAGSSCSWKTLAHLAVEYFLAKYALKTPSSFGLCVCQEIRTAMSDVTEMMRLAKRIINNFLHADHEPVKFGGASSSSKK